MPDYVAERDKTVMADVVCGTIMSTCGKQINTARGAINRRLRIGGGTMAAHKHEVLLPPSAPDMMCDLDTLVAQYERSLLPAQRELLVIFTMRFAASGTFHEQWEQARGFIRQRLVVDRRLATVAVQHIPGMAGFRAGKPHVHCLMFARELHGSNFLGFTPLAKPGAKRTLADEWQAWRSAHGHG